MSRSDVVYAVAVAATTCVWLAIVGIVRTLRQPREPEELEPTLDLGPEPPALAGFLAGNFKVRRDAVPATLLDFCARGLAEIKRVDVSTYACELGDAAPREELTPYERRVWDLLRKRVRNGVVPAQALTTGPGDESKRWWKGFVNEVIDDAQGRGLSRDLWPRRLAAVVALGAAVPALICGIAWGEDAFYISLVLPAAVIALIYGRRQRDTPEGLEAAARWRAVQAKLAEDPVFAEQPPHAVELWERLLAYGAALGVAPGAIRPIPMGSEPDSRAWSTYGGRWHQVDVTYRRWLQWGWHPGLALLVRLGVAALGVLFLLVFGPFVLDVIDDLDGAVGLIPTAFLAIPAAVVAVSGYLAFLATLDLFTRRTVTGEIVRLRVKGSSDDRRHYVAVDDATSRDVRAWVVRPEIYAGLEQGDVVTAEVTPRLGYVRSITPAAS